MPCSRISTILSFTYMKILLIEDDPVLSRNIREALTAEGMHAECVFDGLLAEKMFKREKYDCIVMDINLPGKNGYDLCRDLRAANLPTPVLMLTAFGDLEDKVKGFDCGADDYLTKPFYMRELLLRIQALIKRAAGRGAEGRGLERITAGDIVIDTSKKMVYRQGSEIQLTPREYQILLILCENSGEIVSKQDLIGAIWGGSFGANTNTVEVYINFLRNKLDKPFGRNSIRTKVGFGYYLDME